MSTSAKPSGIAFGSLLVVIAVLLLVAAWSGSVVTGRPQVSATLPTSPPVAPAEYVPDITAPFLDYDDAWPTRWNPRGGETAGIIWALDAKVSLLGTLRLPATPAAPSDDERSIYAALCATFAAGGDPRPVLGLEGLNSIIFVPGAGGRKRDFRNNFGFGLGPGRAAGPDAELVFVFASGQVRGPKPDDVGAIAPSRVVELQRTWFAYYDAMGDERSPREANGRAVARGTVLLMPGMFGTPEVVLDPLTLRLRAAGYAVLRMLSQPSRFTERRTVRVDPSDLDGSAADIGAVVNDRLGECAFAVQAAWEYVHTKREGAKDLPHAVIGLSGGAISLPTVVARTPSLYSAAVLIGGGADFWLINERSNYQGMIDAVRTIWVGAAATPDSIAAFDAKLLSRARLDGFHTATALRGVRTLLLQGSGDRAVPSALGDVLWERLGRPERWMYPASHEVLCLGLPSETDKILEWLDAALRAPHEDPPRPKPEVPNQGTDRGR